MRILQNIMIPGFEAAGTGVVAHLSMIGAQQGSLHGQALHEGRGARLVQLHHCLQSSCCWVPAWFSMAEGVSACGPGAAQRGMRGSACPVKGASAPDQG